MDASTDADAAVDEDPETVLMLSGGGCAIVARDQSARTTLVFSAFLLSVLLMRRVRRLRKF
jgi:hypothetical protein